MTVLGVDLGVRKIAVSVFHEDVLAQVGAHKSVAELRATQLQELALYGHDMAVLYNADYVFIEEPIVGNNIKYSMNIAMVCGALLSALNHLTPVLDIRFVGNKVWKRDIVGSGNSSKDVIRTWLLDHHPAYAALCEEDQDRCDAVCIGLYGLQLIGRAEHLRLV